MTYNVEEIKWEKQTWETVQLQFFLWCDSPDYRFLVKIYCS